MCLADQAACIRKLSLSNPNSTGFLLIYALKRVEANSHTLGVFGGCAAAHAVMLKARLSTPLLFSAPGCNRRRELRELM